MAACTGFALLAILTGNYPEQGDLPVAADHPRNLFTLLGGRYRLHAQEPLTELCPRALCPPDRASPSARLAAIVSDLEIVSLAVVLPNDLTARLSPVTQGWRDFVRSHSTSAAAAVQVRVRAIACRCRSDSGTPAAAAFDRQSASSAGNTRACTLTVRRSATAHRLNGGGWSRMRSRRTARAACVLVKDGVFNGRPQRHLFWWGVEAEASSSRPKRPERGPRGPRLP